jgi:hypothetical protein
VLVGTKNVDSQAVPGLPYNALFVQRCPIEEQ